VTTFIRNNNEIYSLLNNEDIIRFIKSQRLRWISHVERMAYTRIPKNIYKSSMTGRRARGRPRNRWKMNTGNYRMLAMNRSEWTDVVEQAKAHPEL
jgi:hypothetical protein